MAAPATDKDTPLITLPADLLKSITEKLEPGDEKALKQTCKKMSLLVAPPPPGGSSSLHAPADASSAARDGGRTTPMPQSPMPQDRAKTMEELERENAEAEERGRQQGMELSDTEGGFDDDDDDRSIVQGSKPTKFKGKKNILNWTADLDSRPATPNMMQSPIGASFSQRSTSPSPSRQ